MHPAAANQSKKERTPVMNKPIPRKAFTLIEMLIVVAIIGVLASFAFPAYQKSLQTAKMTGAMNNARQISIALHMYANDNDGNYPTKKNSYDEDIVTSNDAFRSLIPAYLDNERVFAVAGSKAGPSADDQIDDAAHILQPGENHWAFVSGLTPTSKSTWPLVVDHTDGTGHYTTQEKQYGGTWGGTRIVAIATDGSGRIASTGGTGEQRFLPRVDDKTKNALAVSEYMGDGVTLLEPAR